MATKRITKKKYQKARQLVESAREHMRIVKQWDEAVRQLDNADKVDAITVNDDGTIRVELLHQNAGEAKS